MKLKSVHLATLAFCLWLIGPDAAAAAVTLDPATNYLTGQILIQPRAGIRRDTLAAYHATLGATVTRTFDNFGGTQIITVPPGQTVASLLAQYRQSGLVEFAEPDYLVHADATPNDPKFLDGTLWGLSNYGQSSGTPHADIGATNAWSISTSASNIVVCVADSGIRATHEDLASNMWVNPADGGNGYNAFTGTNNPADDDGHGTLVAGVLGAVGNNGKGITGIAWQVQMMACKCLNSNGIGSDSTIVPCFTYAQANGARIINASFSSSTPSLAVSNAIVALRTAGIIVVTSAGNSAANVATSPAYPACLGLDNIVSTAYTTRTDTLGTLSNYGTNVTIAAPGDQIYSTFSSADNAYYPPSGLGINIAGTSFSAAYVSGALALIIAKYPTESYQQIIQRLLTAADTLPSLKGKCLTAGRLNLYNALNPPMKLSAVTPADPGTARFHLATGANRLCTIQSSTNLATWTPVYTNTTSTNGTFDFTNATTPARQFFRATTIP